jgi:4-amino-4-deoxy-L-arabinose transferase-like glycosyltransferase
MSYSWQSNSAASAAPADRSLARSWTLRDRARALAARVPRVELLGVMALAAVLNLWDLSRNGWANQYYAAAVKSMSSNWHDFLFASLDKGGLMTVDKPPLALWVEALSARVFGFNSLSLLVPQALMGVASVALVYDLVRIRFGRAGGFVAGLALALTPIAVAISRHDNPDALLILCSVAALWCVVRAFERASRGAGTTAASGARTPTGTRWLLAAGVCVGLGFETKMLVALVVVPGIVAAWLWIAPAARGRWHALRQLLAGGGAMLLVGGAWPLLVELTPASDRPWVSGTSDNRVLSLIFEYNGLGRVDGQAGGAGGLQKNASNMFGGATGPLRLLNSALGGQAGWLLGFALVAGLGILASSRLRRGDARSGWLVAVGGAFATSAVLFSFASGILHPYYVSLLAPFAAALAGAGAAQLMSGHVNVRVVGPLAVLAGVVVELVVRADYPGQLTWLPPPLIVVGVVAAIALAAFSSRAVRIAAVAAVLAALLAAPGVWAFDTLGHATSGTFPAGGPASVESGGPGGGGPGAGAGGAGGFGRSGGAGGRAGFAGPGAQAGGFAPPGGAEGGPPSGVAGGPPSGVEGTSGTTGAVPQLFGSGASAGGASSGARGFGGRGALGAPVGGSVSASVESYVKQHGGGTIAVSSQSNAASAILDGYDNVAGIGGFSGRESEVSLSWLAQQVRAGKITWVLDEEGTGGSGSGGVAGGRAAGPGGGETRVGARKAMAAVAKACQAVTVSSSGSESGESAKLYDCAGDASALAGAGTQQSRS